MKRPVFLIGFMCSGKTTLGGALARAFNVPFVDLDRYIEAKAGMTVKEIFAAMGEGSFREMERQALAEVSGESAVVACGGGTPCRPGAMELMNQRGITLYLRPSDQAMVSRLMHGRRKRPLIAHIDNEADMLRFALEKIDERAPYYTLAQYSYDSSRLETPEQIACSVAEVRNLLKI